MRQTSARFLAALALLALLGSVVVVATGTKDNALERIATYKNWTPVLPQLEVGTITLDIASVAG